METPLFDFAAQKLEQHTGFSQLEARGTLRIAVKSAGLEPKSLTVAELRVVLEKLMPGELEQRGVKDTLSVCSAVLRDLEDAPIAESDSDSSNPDDIFRRLAKA
ncbi:MAG: hypothetical protein JRF15_11910 [Deltaproteobacteria bacterium]|jgi:hypothetical protein|nr:hypothetical protein [Deltaproteobacteria bacterium]